MTDLSDRDLSGSRFVSVDFSGSTFRNVALKGVVMRDVEIADTDISGDIEGLTVNGVDVGPLVDAELDRRHPERTKLRPTDVAGFREAWEILGGLWGQTVEKARRLEPALLHESVDGEWSFVETLRHLAFATDSWVDRAILGNPSPWHPLDLPWDTMTPTPGVPWDRDARPSLDEALALRSDRQDGVRRLLADLTDARLAADTDPVDGPGWPPAGETFPVGTCLRIVLNEEWWHRRYAERDLDALLARSGG
jgi:uncharacterized protein YjbI with pentapeptide repeats